MTSLLDVLPGNMTDNQICNEVEPECSSCNGVLLAVLYMDVLRGIRWLLKPSLHNKLCSCHKQDGADCNCTHE